MSRFVFQVEDFFFMSRFVFQVEFFLMSRIFLCRDFYFKSRFFFSCGDLYFKSRIFLFMSRFIFQGEFFISCREFFHVDIFLFKWRMCFYRKSRCSLSSRLSSFVIFEVFQVDISQYSRRDVHVTQEYLLASSSNDKSNKITWRSVF